MRDLFGKKAADDGPDDGTGDGIGDGIGDGKQGNFDTDLIGQKVVLDPAEHTDHRHPYGHGDGHFGRKFLEGQKNRQESSDPDREQRRDCTADKSKPQQHPQFNKACVPMPVDDVAPM